MTRCRFASAAPDTDLVYGACEPGFDSAVATPEAWAEYMQKQGIERVLCLLEYTKVSDHKRLLERYQTEFGDTHVKHVPLTDHRIMRQKKLTNEILPFLTDSVRHQQPVDVHCKAGIGRTGQVLAAWLVYQHGYTPTEAVQTVSDRKRNPNQAIELRLARQEELTELLESVQ